MASIPLPDQLGTVEEFFAYLNEQTAGAFGPFLIFAVGIVTFVSMKNYEGKAAAAVSAYIMLLLALIARAMGIIPVKTLAIFLVIGAGATLWLVFGGRMAEP